jgi:hypothetical protein
VRAVPLVGDSARGRVTFIAEDAWDRVTARPWHVHEGIRVGKAYGPYAAATADASGAVLLLHTFLTGESRVDHWNGDGLDNRPPNLRKADRSQNGANRGKAGYRGRPASSRFKGVSLNKRDGVWQAKITIAGRLTHLAQEDGCVHARPLPHDAREACPACAAAQEVMARMYDAAALRVFGDYALLNFPVPGRRQPPARLAQPHEVPPSDATPRCGHCREEFMPSRAGQKYCSPGHRQAAFQARARRSPVTRNASDL